MMRVSLISRPFLVTFPVIFRIPYTPGSLIILMVEKPEMLSWSMKTSSSKVYFRAIPDSLFWYITPAHLPSALYWVSDSRGGAGA